MLNQDSEAREQIAAQKRVKKEEFARAITSLEARRQAEEQQREGTVVLGDVLQQLQINLPAEAVLQEIEAIQAGRPREKISRPPFWNAERIAGAKLVSGIVFVPLAALGLGSLMLNPLNMSRTTNMKGTSVAVAGDATGNYSVWPPPNLPGGATGEMMDESGFNASSVLKPLSSVPESQPVHCTTASLQKLLTATDSQSTDTDSQSTDNLPALTNPAALAQSSQPFDVRPNLHKPWVLIKHDGSLYLRGWVTTKFTEAQAQGRFVTLHSAPSSFEPGVQPVPITLLAKFRPYFSGNSHFESQPATLQVEGVNLDQHTWETW